jgi:hypothetical protein
LDAKPDGYEIGLAIFPALPNQESAGEGEARAAGRLAKLAGESKCGSDTRLTARRRKNMLDKTMIKLGQRIAKEPHANDKLLNYIFSAAVTVQGDDLTMPDAWENLICDLECALAVAMARRVSGDRPA